MKQLPQTAMGFQATPLSKEIPRRNINSQMRQHQDNEKQPFYANYKDICFDTLKQRHDNFSFDKALESKQKLHDTLHFQGLYQQPHHPKLILFKKILESKEQSQRESYTGYTARSKQFAGSSQYSSQEIPSNSNNLASKEYGRSTDPRGYFNSEEQMWFEFHSHFGDSHRNQTPANHHDFISAKRQQQPLSKLSQASAMAERLLTHNNRLRTELNYQIIQQNAVPMPSSFAKQQKVTQQYIIRGRQRLQHRIAEEAKRNIPDLHQLTDKALTQRKTNKAEDFEKNMKKRKFPERHIFVLIDGQDLLTPGELLFSHLEVNEKLCRIVPQNIWDSKLVQNLDFYSRVEHAKASALFHENIIMQSLDEINQKLNNSNLEPLNYCWTLDGQSVKSFMSIHQDCRILIASNKSVFQGLKGLIKFATAVRPEQTTQEIKPKPATWVQTAAVSWLKNNDVEDLPNFNQDLSHFGANDMGKNNQQAQLFEALRDEHHRVHVEDQNLLSQIKQIGSVSFLKRGQAAIETNLLIQNEKQRELRDKLKEQKRSFVITSSHELYPYTETEENLIKYLLEKVIVMREVPYMQIANTLERNHNKQNLKTYMKELDGGKKFTFAAKPQNRRGINVDMTKIKQTEPYEGESFQAGKATFKYKNRSPAETKTDFNQTAKYEMLKNEEIQAICEEHALSRGEVYDIHTSFKSMVTLSEMYLQETGGQQAFEKTQPGINIEYFIKNCKFLVGVLPQINRRILIAAGIDANNQRIQLTWKKYLELHCIFESGQIEPNQLVNFWKKFFDQNMSGSVQEKEYLQCLEELIRGTALSQANKATKNFALMYQNELSKAGCLGENNVLIMSKLGEAFMSGKLDTKLLSNAMGNKDLSEEFASMSTLRVLNALKDVEVV